MDWQPIETAPKDGTRIIVWPPTWPQPCTSCAVYDDDRYARKPRPYWRRLDEIQRRLSRMTPPTHWRPCLSGPNEQKGGAS